LPIIRPAEKADIPRLLELYQELSLSTSHVEKSLSPSAADYERAFERMAAVPGLELLVLEEGGEVAGVAEFLIVPNLSHKGLPWAAIESLIVDERFRREGFGRMLMAHAIMRAREAGCYKLVLTSNKKRLEAHKFYRSLGFEETSLGFRLNF
jgi:ribosomal protein S18 acetylase RimI-like enzyme